MQRTAYELRISDWSSDVCSSDLLRSRPYDGEGLPVSPTVIVADGVLETWLLDSAAARQLGLEPTGHAARGGGVSPGNLAMAAGKVPRDTLIGEIENGVLVTEVIGQGVNLITGDYSRGASGFLIDAGEIVAHVRKIKRDRKRGGTGTRVEGHVESGGRSVLTN